MLVAHNHNQGFTLIEIMVVIVIIGVLAGVTVLAIGGTESRRLNAEATELRVMLNHFMDRTLMQQKNIKWRYNPVNNRCHYYVLDNQDQWQKNRDKKHTGCTFKLVTNLSLQYPESLVEPNFDNPESTLYFFSSGEYTPFRLLVSGRNQLGLVLFGDGLNTIKMEAISK